MHVHPGHLELGPKYEVGTISLTVLISLERLNVLPVWGAKLAVFRLVLACWCWPGVTVYLAIV